MDVFALDSIESLELIKELFIENDLTSKLRELTFEFYLVVSVSYVSFECAFCRQAPC